MREQEKAGNIVLAEFMGHEKLSPYLAFHISLDALYPVWVKFRETKEAKSDVWVRLSVMRAFDNGTIKNIFDQMVYAVKWYNSINK